MRYLLSLVLWAAFATIVAVVAFGLLQACGLSRPGGLPAGWNFCPVEPDGLSAEAERHDRLLAEAARLQRALADKARDCAAIPPPKPPPLNLPTEAGRGRPQQTAALRPPPPPPPPPRAPADLDAERWRNRDLSALEGCWRLGQDAPMTWRQPNGVIIESNCTQRAGRLCFDHNGNGSNEESGFCPSGRIFDCRAPMTAHFAADGSLVAQHPTVANACNTGPLFERKFVCQRVDDTKAICERYDRFGQYTLEFRR